MLLTATIAPGQGAVETADTDASRRLEDYVAALRFYLAELARGTFDRLVFADNSGHPLDRLAAVVAETGTGDRVDLLSFDQRSEPALAKFYLELGLIAEALRREPLSSLHAEDRVWKVTGRYVIRNIADIIRTAPREADLYVNSRNRPLPWTDFYVAAFTTWGFCAAFADRASYHEPRVPGEMILRRRIDAGDLASLRVVPRMRRVPRISGVRGYDGRRYDDWRSTTKYYARAMADRLLPRLWI